MKIRIHWAEPDVGEEEAEAVKEVIKSGWISGTTPYTERLEKEFANLVQAKYAKAVCNGTAGLMLGLLALRKKGINLDIAVPTWTYIATVNTAQLFGRIKFVDCSKETFNMDYSKIPQTSLIMPADIGGLSLDYDRLKKLDWKPTIFADSAEAVGSIYKGKLVGSQVLLHLFSFHATKVITTGEGGILTTNDKELYRILTYLNNQGYGKGKKPWDYNHPEIGYNFRMPSLQAVIASIQLKKLSKYLKKRKEFAKIYRDILGDKVDYQKIPRGRKSSYFLFTILVDPQKKDKIIKGLFKAGIQVKAWKPVHLQPPYRRFRFPKLPNAEYIYERNIHLPIHNKLTEEEVKEVAEKVEELL